MPRRRDIWRCGIARYFVEEILIAGRIGPDIHRLLEELNRGRRASPDVSVHFSVMVKFFHAVHSLLIGPLFELGNGSRTATSEWAGRKKTWS